MLKNAIFMRKKIKNKKRWIKNVVDELTSHKPNEKNSPVKLLS